MEPSLEGAVAEATILIRTIDRLEGKAAPYWWDLADLSAANVNENGRPPKTSERLGSSEWAEQIGWTEENGKSLKTLKDAISLSRAWPKALRVETASFWQHREALDFKGSVEEASVWLASAKGSVRDKTRSGLDDDSAVYDAIRLLVRARRMILRVPAILAGADALGTEPGFDRLRDEIKRMKRGMTYIDRFLADETVIDMDEFQAGLDEILREAS